jgi:hypothetical protein
MTKHIWSSDVVHHERNMMQIWHKIALPKVGIPCVFGVSALSTDNPASLIKALLPQKQGMTIKLWNT